MKRSLRCCNIESWAEKESGGSIKSLQPGNQKTEQAGKWSLPKSRAGGETEKAEKLIMAFDR